MDIQFNIWLLFLFVTAAASLYGYGITYILWTSSQEEHDSQPMDKVA